MTNHRKIKKMRPSKSSKPSLFFGKRRGWNILFNELIADFRKEKKKRLVEVNIEKKK